MHLWYGCNDSFIYNFNTILIDSTIQFFMIEYYSFGNFIWLRFIYTLKKYMKKTHTHPNTDYFVFFSFLVLLFQFLLVSFLVLQIVLLYLARTHSLSGTIYLYFGYTFYSFFLWIDFFLFHLIFIECERDGCTCTYDYGWIIRMNCIKKRFFAHNWLITKERNKQRNTKYSTLYGVKMCV